MNPTEYLDISILVSYVRRFMTAEVDSYNLRKFIVLATEVDCLLPLYCLFIILSDSALRKPVEVLGVSTYLQVVTSEQKPNL